MNHDDTQLRTFVRRLWRPEKNSVTGLLAQERNDVVVVATVGKLEHHVRNLWLQNKTCIKSIRKIRRTWSAAARVRSGTSWIMC